MICCRRNWHRAGLPSFLVAMKHSAGNILYPLSENWVSSSLRAARPVWWWTHPYLPHCLAQEVM